MYAESAVKFLCGMLYCFTLLIGGMPSPANAQIELKVGQGAASPIRAKAIDAVAHIDGPFAVTHLAITFQNELPTNTEADFLYTLPDGAVVTTFAYYFGDEKVKAQIVEKQKAAEIYASLTRLSRDPALVEQISHNRFRARIAPVMANADLKVEMDIVQAIPIVGYSCSYTFPIDPQSLDTMFDDVHLVVHLAANAGIASIVNNVGLPMISEPGGSRIELSGRNYHPQKALTVREMLKKTTLCVFATSARSGGADGYFALSLTPNHTISNPSLAMAGASVYDMTSLPKSIRAGRSGVVYGRYRQAGSLDAAVRLTGKAAAQTEPYTGRIMLSNRAEPNSPAIRLWAAHWISHLTAQGGSRKAIITLSYRYGLPTRYTSWLAIPKQERERMEWERKRLQSERAEPRIRAVAKKLAAEVVAGRGSGTLAATLNSQLEALCAPTIYTTQSVLHDEYQTYVNGPTADLISLMVAGHGDTPDAVRLRERLQTFCAFAGTTPESQLHDCFYSYVSEAARSVAASEVEGGRETADYAQKRSAYELMCKMGGYDPDVSLDSYLDDASARMFNEVSDLLAREIGEGRETDSTARMLRARRDALISLRNAHPFTRHNLDTSENDITRRAKSAHANYLIRQLADLIKDGNEASPEARRLSGELIAQNPTWFDQSAFSPTIQSVANELALYIDGSKHDPAAESRLRERLKLLFALTGYHDSYRYMEQALSPVIEKTSRQLALEVRQNRGDSPLANHLYERLKSFCTQAKRDPESAMNYALYDDITDVTDDLVRIVRSPHDAPSRRAADLIRLKKLCRFTGENPATVLFRSLETDINDLAGDIIVRSDRGDSPAKLAAANKRLEELCSLTGQSPSAMLLSAGEGQADILANELLAAKRGQRVIVHHGDDHEFVKVGKPNPERAAYLYKQLGRLHAVSGISVQEAVDRSEYWYNFDEAERISAELNTAAGKGLPSTGALKAKLIQVGTHLKGRDNAEARAELVIERAVRQRTSSTPTDREKALHVRMGDPLIAIVAPADALRVVAVMPDGTVKLCVFDGASKTWQARFDVPAYYHEKAYDIAILIVLANGERRRLSSPYMVDLTPPSGEGQAIRANSGGTLRLSISASPDTARVTALLSDGRSVNLSRSEGHSHAFFSLVETALDRPVSSVTYILTDLAHNRTSITVGASQ